MRKGDKCLLIRTHGICLCSPRVKDTGRKMTFSYVKKSYVFFKKNPFPVIEDMIALRQCHPTFLRKTITLSKTLYFQIFLKIKLASFEL